jgi:hypothetical protein
LQRFCCQEKVTNKAGRRENHFSTVGWITIDIAADAVLLQLQLMQFLIVQRASKSLLLQAIWGFIPALRSPPEAVRLTPLQSLPEGGACGSILNDIHHSKSGKLLQGAPVLDLAFKLCTAEGEKLLEIKHLEKDQRINPLTPCIALAHLRIALIKKWVE